MACQFEISIFMQFLNSLICSKVSQILCTSFSLWSDQRAWVPNFFYRLYTELEVSISLRMLTICFESIPGGCLLSFPIALLHCMFGSEYLGFLYWTNFATLIGELFSGCAIKKKYLKSFRASWLQWNFYNNSSTHNLLLLANYSSKLLHHHQMQCNLFVLLLNKFKFSYLTSLIKFYLIAWVTSLDSYLSVIVPPTILIPTQNSKVLAVRKGRKVQTKGYNSS